MFKIISPKMKKEGIEGKEIIVPDRILDAYQIFEYIFRTPIEKCINIWLEHTVKDYLD